VVVVETETGEKAGIVVDELQGKQQVVMKSLEENYEPIVGISAATIMGDGSVVPILDVNAICDIRRRKV
jgi:two-component system chemotaxis sensor kinase CheA